MDAAVLNRALERPPRYDREAVLRTVFAPMRNEEVIDAVEIGRDVFRERIVTLATDNNVGMFSAWHAKAAELRGHALAIRQDPGRLASASVCGAGIEPKRAAGSGVERHGAPVAEIRNPAMAGLQILESDVLEVLGQQFSFARSIYDLVDQFQRQHAITYNCAVLGAAYRLLSREPATGGPVSMSMRGDGPIIVHAQPRQVGRPVLTAPQPEIERTLELLRRRMRD